jgi:hypothetical protein
VPFPSGVLAAVAIDARSAAALHEAAAPFPAA